MPTPASYYMDNVFGQCQPVRKEAPAFSFDVKRHMPKNGMVNQHPAANVLWCHGLCSVH